MNSESASIIYSPELLLSAVSKRIELIQKNIYVLLNDVNAANRDPRMWAWRYSAIGESSVYGYLATNDFKYIELVLKTLEYYLSATDAKLGFVDAKRKRLVNGWGTWTDRGPISEISNTGTILYPLALLSIFASNNEEIKGSILKVATDCIVVIDELVSEIYNESGLVWMVSPIDGQVEPWNHVHQFAAALLAIGTLLDLDRYIQMGRCFLNTFMHLIERGENDTYSWTYRPPLSPDGSINYEKPNAKGKLPRSMRPEQIWKGVTTIKLPLVAYLLGFLSLNEINRFCNIFTRNINLGKNQFNSFISRRAKRILDPSTIKTESRRPRVQNLAHWMILAPFAPDISTIIENAVINRKDLFPEGWFGVNRSIVGYAVQLFMKSESYNRNCCFSPSKQKNLFNL